MCKDTTYTQSALWVQILKKKVQITVLRVGIYCLLIYSYEQLQWNETLKEQLTNLTSAVLTNVVLLLRNA